MDLAGAINAVPGAADSLLNILRGHGSDAFPLALAQVIAVAKIQIAFGWGILCFAAAITGGIVFIAKVDEDSAWLTGLVLPLILLIPVLILFAEGYTHLASPEWYALEKVRSLLP